MKFQTTIPIFQSMSNSLGPFRYVSLAFVLLLVSSCNGQPMNVTAGPTASQKLAPRPAGQTDSVFNWAGSSLLVKAYMPETDMNLQVSQYIRRLLQDRSGFIWFGTQGDGACRFDGKDLLYFKKGQGLAGNVVRGMVQDAGGNIWFATEQGLSRYNLEQADAPCNLGTCVHDMGAVAEREKHDAELRKSFSNFSVKDGLLHNDIWSIAKDSKGNIWCGTMAGLNRFDGNKFSSFPLTTADVQPNSRFSPNLVWSIFEDKAGNMWFGTDGAGIRKYDGNNMTVYTTKNGLADNNVMSILQDRTGALWFGTRFGGVSRFDGKAFTNFSVKEGLSNPFINPMLQDKTGKIWMGTNGGGVCRIDPETIGKDPKAIQHFGAGSGLFNQHVQSILEDKHGNLWIGTSGGVYMFDGKKFINFRRSGC